MCVCVCVLNNTANQVRILGRRRFTWHALPLNVFVPSREVLGSRTMTSFTPAHSRTRWPLTALQHRISFEHWHQYKLLQCKSEKCGNSTAGKLTEINIVKMKAFCAKRNSFYAKAMSTLNDKALHRFIYYAEHKCAPPRTACPPVQ